MQELLQFLHFTYYHYGSHFENVPSHVHAEASICQNFKSKPKQCHCPCKYHKKKLQPNLPSLMKGNFTFSTQKNLSYHCAQF